MLMTENVLYLEPIKLTQERPVRMESFHWKVPKPMASTASSTINVSERMSRMKVSVNTEVDTFELFPIQLRQHASITFKLM